jgi:hypothetical protein
VRKHTPTLLVAAVLVATATAFAVSEHLKLEDSPVLGTRVPGLFSPRKVDETIGFRLRREERIRLDVADSSGAIIRHGIGRGVFGQAFHQFAWDGRDDAGRIVPDGTYRFQLRLEDEGRTIEFPSEVRADSTPPTIDELTVRHAVFSPDGDGRADRVDLRYRFSEPAFAILYVDGKPRGASHGHKQVGTRQWYGRGAAPGEHRLALAAQDMAGNIAGSSREFTVRLRFVELPKTRYVVRGHTLRLRVSTDAARLRWRLGSRGGTVRKQTFRIPVPSRSGRYRLTVRANGHSARATVLVRPAGR